MMHGCRWHNKKEIMGVWILSVLLSDKLHGYELIQRINANPFLGPVNPGVVYRTLRELEMAGLVTSEWDFGRGPARRLYSITSKGKQWLKQARPYFEEYKRFIEGVLERLNQ